MPHVSPIQRVELSDTNVKARLILLVVLLAIATVSIAVGLSSVLRTEPGWQKIEVQTMKMNCGTDFVLNYDFTDAGSSASAQFKKLTTLYTAACEDAFRIFSADVPGGETANVHDVNQHPNETMTVDPALYHAFSLVQEHQNRNLYLGGIYTEYNRIFMSETAVEAASYDPAQNPELLADLTQMAAFANDPSMIDLQLLGDNQVKLVVSEAYLSYAKANEIERLIDFSWMKNAFIADYLAEVLSGNGFTDGYLASFDGFTRNLDKRGNGYIFNVFDRLDRDINLCAQLKYASPSAIVFLRDYPMGQSDVWHYYAFENGRIASLLIDPADGVNKTAIDSLVSYAAEQNCAEILLQVIPVMIADDFSASELRDLATSGVHSIWCENQILYHTDADVDLTVHEQEETAYTKVFAG